METQCEELSGAEQALAHSRARGDFVINCALDWIVRFHTQSSPFLIERLTEGIRSLLKSMHTRSVDDIVSNIDKLLDIQSQFFLSGGSTQGGLELADQIVVPRVHEEWTQSQYFSPKEHQNRKPVQKRGPVFISYARSDSDWLEKLRIHLRPLERSGKIELWHDGRLKPGEPWRKNIVSALNKASVAILLLTANFMASDFIYNNELQPIAKRAIDGGVVVFPVIIGHCLLEEDDYLSDLQLFNDPETPLSRLDSSEVDKVLVNLAKAVRELCELEKGIS